MSLSFTVDDLILAGIPVRVHEMPDGCDRCGGARGGDGMRYAAALLCVSCCQELADQQPPGSLVDRPEWRVFLGREPDPRRRVEWVAELSRQVLEFGPIELGPAQAWYLSVLVESARRRETDALIESAYREGSA